MTFKKSVKLNKNQLSDTIHNVLESGHIIYSSHFKDMMKDRGYTSVDIMTILRFGRLVGAKFSKKNNSWKYKIEGMGVEGEKGTIILTVLSTKKILLVTALGG